MPTQPVQRVLQLAAKYIGEHEHPMGSNTGAFVQECQSHTFLGGTGWPWCAAFCHRVFDEAGKPFPFKSASAFGMLTWARKVGWTVPAPKPGCLGVVSHGAGHICIVESYDPATKLVSSIDGNVSDSVAPRHRHLNEFRGFIWHPALGKTVAIVPKVREPWWVATTSENGHVKVLYRGPGATLLPKLPGLLKNTANGVTVKRGKR